MNHNERKTFLRERSTFKDQLNWENVDQYLAVIGKVYLEKDGIEIINKYQGCVNCHTGFQIDSYLNGCTHDCIYCYAKIEGELRNEWNTPSPIPLDITIIWNIFYEVFESQKINHYSEILLKKIPIRIGSLSDGFIPLEKKLGISYELIRLFQHYEYPFLIVTRSDLVSNEEYINLLNPKYATVQVSIPSLDEEKTKILEPGAPSPDRRLDSVKKLVNKKIWTTVRINPLFPCFKDGSLANGEKWEDLIKKEHFIFFNKDLVRKISETGCKSILVGFANLKKHIIQSLSLKMKFDINSLMSESNQNGDLIFSQNEIRKYYVEIHHEAKKFGLEFTTCYLGQGEKAYFQNQDLWDNSGDCCNIKDKIDNVKSTAVDIKNDYSIEEENIFKKLLLLLLGFLLKNLKK